jgi:putative transposase
MPIKRHKPEEIVAKLRQVDVLIAQGKPVAVTSPRRVVRLEC